ncbi:YkgJ family cysteine cluster protein [Uliginosibacterium sediminicola]|uniref:YkgJ family cysteine cluster protein n=1 Tax=Uliginosibacterium sediminicola TaxID=2024550 RepID=A0ABU9YZ48_9RHOO
MSPLPSDMSAHSTGEEISCSNCEACCCKLEVILMGEDAVPRHLTREDAWGGEVMRRLDDGWCVALDRDSMLCNIYERRPGVCRDYEMGGVECIEERAHLDAARPLRRWPLTKD